ncbi:MAG: hypothetical protein NPINA01_29810 [Nitrospinaceae bacterium]|nr:MAG: hypothetical protein NPINA01_29810 [Nitrospinaceae bacterium]
MTQFQIKKMAVSFSLFSFAILMFGSLLTGSRMTTAFIRGIEAALLFGAIAWGLGSLIMDKAGEEPVKEEEEASSQETPLDETV